MELICNQRERGRLFCKWIRLWFNEIIIFNEINIPVRAPLGTGWMVGIAPHICGIQAKLAWTDLFFLFFYFYAFGRDPDHHQMTHCLFLEDPKAYGLLSHREHWENQLITWRVMNYMACNWAAQRCPGSPGLDCISQQEEEITLGQFFQ